VDYHSLNGATIKTSTLCPESRICSTKRRELEFSPRSI
jgi:hypothetical protein